MKTKLLPILRYIVLALLLLCIVLCRFFPVMAEGYARHIYPWLSAALSAIASVFPFSLEEVLVVVIILWMIIYPFLKRRKKKSWRFIVGREVELLAWVYIWFYLGLRYVLCTEISKDGTLQGPAIELYKEVMAAYPQLHLIASGGVSCNEDIEALETAGIPAVVFGKAFYEGKIDVKKLVNS